MGPQRNAKAGPRMSTPMRGQQMGPQRPQQPPMPASSGQVGATGNMPPMQLGPMQGAMAPQTSAGYGQNVQSMDDRFAAGQAAYNAQYGPQQNATQFGGVQLPQPNAPQMGPQRPMVQPQLPPTNNLLQGSQTGFYRQR